MLFEFFLYEGGIFFVQSLENEMDDDLRDYEEGDVPSNGNGVIWPRERVQKSDHGKQCGDGQKLDHIPDDHDDCKDDTEEF